MNLSVENVLMIVLVAFALHYLMRNCGCRVEGLKNKGDCCNMGECGPRLSCNATSMTSKCMWEPGQTWYGVCDWDAVDEFVDEFVWQPAVELAELTDPSDLFGG